MHGSAIVLTALITSIVTSLGAVYAIERYNILPQDSAATETQVPDFRGSSEKDALTSSNAARLGLFVASYEQSAEVKGGTVIRQSVAPGQKIPRDSVISVVLAQELPKVTNVVGVTIAEATERLRQQGYNLQVGRTVTDDSVAAGVVVSQVPAADSALAKGASVSVDVSSGPGTVEVPKLIGLGVNSAKVHLEKLGLKMTMRWVSLAETPTFVVLNQVPPAGTKVGPGGEVMLTACQ